MARSEAPEAPPAVSVPLAARSSVSKDEAERDLFRRLQLRGDRRAREALVERFLPLARQLARRYRRSSESLDDLEQVASLALVKAIDRFDVSRGTAFSSFLVPTVLGELKRHFRDSAWAAHVPRRMQERVMRVTGTIDELASESGHAPTIAEIADRSDQSTEEVLEALEASQAFQARPLEGPRRDDEQDEAGQLPELGRTEAGYDLVELGASVRPTVESLPEREREILRLRFVEDLTQSQIAERIGISQMHVSRLIRTTIAKLEAAADEEDERSADPAADAV